MRNRVSAQTIPDAHSALLVPMLSRHVGVGVLAAFDRGSVGGAFTDDDEQLLRAFATSAANAVALKRSVEANRLRAAISAADGERGRWARELHDQTLQALVGFDTEEHTSGFGLADMPERVYLGRESDSIVAASCSRRFQFSSPGRTTRGSG